MKKFACLQPCFKDEVLKPTEKIWLDETWFSHSLKDLLPLFSDPLLHFTQRNKTVGWHYQGKTELGKRFKGVWYFKAGEGES